MMKIFEFTNTGRSKYSVLSKCKNWVKERIKGYPLIWGFYQLIQCQIKRLVLLRYFMYDVKNSYLNMYWGVSGKRGYIPLSAEILFNYHKIEKALSLPVEKRLFGLEAVERLIALLDIWNIQTFSQQDQIYLGAIDTLSAYEKCLHELNLDPENKVYSKVANFLAAHQAVYKLSQPTTPMHVNFSEAEANKDFHSVFASLVSLRRSVRDYSTRLVEKEKIKKSVKLAQMSPSACNRQPCRVYTVDDADKKKNLLAFQNGNRGFGHTIPVVAIITADEQCFFDASERHEAFIDGGLFSMTLAYALQSFGISSCCLNWCVPPSHDIAVHRIFNIPNSERIIMLMAIGYANNSALVPRSHRKSIEWVFREI